MHLFCPNNEKIKWILFDLDGVMVFPWGFAKKLATEYNITRGDTMVFFRDIFPDCARGKTDLKTALAPYLNKWSWKKGVDQFVIEWLQSEHMANPKMVELVKSLRKEGYLVGVASNQEAYREKYIKKEMGFGSLFDKLFISCNLGAIKPEQGFYKSIQSQINTEPEEILFIDDEEKYVKAAQELNWHSFQFQSYEALINSNNDREFYFYSK